MLHPRRQLLVFLGLTVLTACGSPAAVEVEPPATTTVILVRHAEKAPEPKDDPPLTEEGRLRAQALVETLGEAGIQTIYSTQFLRTRETVRPLAGHLGLEVTTLPMNLEDVDEDVARLAERIRDRHPGEVLLVAGHTHVVPMLIERLGGPAMAHLDESDYQNLFIVSVAGGKTHLVRARYGPPNLHTGELEASY